MKKFILLLLVFSCACYAEMGDQSIFDLAKGEFSISRKMLSLDKCEVFFIAKIINKQVEVVVSKNLNDNEIRRKASAFNPIIESLNKTSLYIIYGSSGKKSQAEFLFLDKNMLTIKVQHEGEFFAEIRIPESLFLTQCAKINDPLK